MSGCEQSCEKAEALIAKEFSKPAVESCHLDAAKDATIANLPLGGVNADGTVGASDEQQKAWKADFSMAELNKPDAPCAETKEIVEGAAAEVDVEEKVGVASPPSAREVKTCKLSPSSRAASKKEQVLAQVAQDQASKKKELFVFGKSSIKAPTSNVKK